MRTALLALFVFAATTLHAAPPWEFANPTIVDVGDVQGGGPFEGPLKWVRLTVEFTPFLDPLVDDVAWWLPGAPEGTPGRPEPLVLSTVEGDFAAYLWMGGGYLNREGRIPGNWRYNDENQVIGLSLFTPQSIHPGYEEGVPLALPCNYRLEGFRNGEIVVQKKLSCIPEPAGIILAAWAVFVGGFLILRKRGRHDKDAWADFQGSIRH